MEDSTRFVLTIGAAALFAGCSGSEPFLTTPVGATNALQPKPGNKTFYYTGRAQKFSVPRGVRKITVVLRGAAGDGDSGYPCDPDCFGRGARVYAEIPVTPAENLYVYVGGDGGDRTGGFNGGGAPGISPSYDVGNGGGGASDVREGGRALADRILVAAGGGGAGFGSDSQVSPGGEGGGLTGGHGGGRYGSGGSGGTQTQGGAGGAGYTGSCSQSGQPGGNGVLGVGGNGGNGIGQYNGGGPGGGGGGGYYGGGGGGGVCSSLPGGGGGGGSSYVERSAIKYRMWAGWKRAKGNGLVVFSWR
jgi:Glycine rich protein